MFFRPAAFALLALTPLPLAAETGDAVAGAAQFIRCKACHAIVTDDGTVVQKGGKTGPNLYGMIGRPVAAMPDFRYSPGFKAAGSAGRVWDAANLAAYLADPTAWLRQASGDAGARTSMTVKMTEGSDDLVAYLATQVPAPMASQSPTAPNPVTN
ncbi:c-type cytochrome [Rhodobacter ferrooxidans]|uniref:Cytochrome c class I n=1 Tax=Rhodobacter ferrooxidans TaxID=371731 RepID=C8S0F6_9RHOB|nr:hypothetical protein [Rhodobacter sp. SW2]EEW25490.1 cytochrome c class I [Rhodobacter sp. SW2]